MKKKRNLYVDIFLELKNEVPAQASWIPQYAAIFWSNPAVPSQRVSDLVKSTLLEKSATFYLIELSI